jgi:release factor glutamine methyltransferase
LPLPGRYLDLCTGSGCVAISLARERPAAKLWAVDLSTDALAVARENSIRLGCVHQIAWLSGDLFRPLATLSGPKFELIVANPPYIAEPELASLPLDIRAFEPHVALTGGEDGLDVTRRIVAESPRYLTAGGVLAVEMGTGQTDRVKQLFAEAGFSAILVDKDYGGHDRVMSGVAG